MGFFSFFKKKEPPKQPTREELLKNMAEESYNFYKIYDERERQLLYDNIPNLYKCMPFPRLQSMIEDKSITFVSPETWIDPFETKYWFFVHFLGICN